MSGQPRGQVQRFAPERLRAGRPRIFREAQDAPGFGAVGPAGAHHERAAG